MWREFLFKRKCTTPCKNKLLSPVKHYAQVVQLASQWRKIIGAVALSVRFSITIVNQSTAQLSINLGRVHISDICQQGRRH